MFHAVLEAGTNGAHTLSAWLKDSHPCPELLDNVYRHAYSLAMSKETTAFRLDTTLLETMRRVKLQDGIPVTRQIEMAVREWLVKRGALKNADRRRAPRTPRDRRRAPHTHKP